MKRYDLYYSSTIKKYIVIAFDRYAGDYAPTVIIDSVYYFYNDKYGIDCMEEIPYLEIYEWDSTKKEAVLVRPVSEKALDTGCLLYTGNR